MAVLFPAVATRAPTDPAARERTPLVAATGFREYDARWRTPQELNLMGAQALGLALATLLRQRHGRAALVVGHDYRSYSQGIKLALVSGLLAGGADVHDIGLALSPMAYFAQTALKVRGVAMVTASHNENGWTGIKMGDDPPLTFGPEDMQALKTLVLKRRLSAPGGGRYRYVADMHGRYLRSLRGRKLRRPLKAVLACGNGTAGAFAPQALEGIGVKTVPLHCELDYAFPHHNPNPEDMGMLHALSRKVRAERADIGFAFDGDGDRCGVVDARGREIFSDKVGLILARWLAPQHTQPQFVADVKSTSLFMRDPVLQQHGARVHYGKTGHSYMKRETQARRALVGFEKSGHFFFGPPLGRGYDDGLVSALWICRMLDASGQSLHQLAQSLPPSWSSPSCSPHCADARKYQLVARVQREFEQRKKRGEPFAGQAIDELMTVNGVRVVLADGSWTLVRASSNKPSLVVVCESMRSKAAMRELFDATADLLARYPEVGAFDQRP